MMQQSLEIPKRGLNNSCSLVQFSGHPFFSEGYSSARDTVIIFLIYTCRRKELVLFKNQIDHDTESCEISTDIINQLLY